MKEIIASLKSQLKEIVSKIDQLEQEIGWSWELIAKSKNQVERESIAGNLDAMYSRTSKLNQKRRAIRAAIESLEYASNIAD